MFEWLKPTPVDGPRLRILAAALEGYRFMFRHKGAALWLTLFPALCITGVHFALFGFAPPSEDPEAALGLVLTSLGELGVVLLLVPIVLVAWQRRILLGPKYAKMRLGRREGRMLVTLFVLGLLIGLGVLAAFMLVNTVVGWIDEVDVDLTFYIAAVVTYLAIAYVTGRLYFLLPPRAMDRKLSVMEAWDMSGGYGMKLMVIVVLVGLPGVGLSQILSPVAAAALEDGAVPLLVGVTFIGNILLMFKIVIEAAALTICYAALGGIEEILEVRGVKVAPEPELVE